MTESGKGIILYDSLRVVGGAEAVTICMAENLPNTELCVDFASPEFSDAIAKFKFEFYQLGKQTSRVGWDLIKGVFNFRSKTRFEDRDYNRAFRSKV